MGHKNSKVFVATMFLLLITCAEPSVAAPELSSSQEQDAEALFSSLMSPFCPGRLISDCPSGKASELKDVVRSELASGKTIETIKGELYAQFGENILRPVPEERGFGLLAWILPGAFFLIGLAVVARWLQSLHKEDLKVQSQTLPTFDAALEERVRRDLENL